MGHSACCQSRKSTTLATSAHLSLQKTHPVLVKEWHRVSVLFFPAFPVILSLLFCWWSIGHLSRHPFRISTAIPPFRNRHTALIKFSFLCQTGLEMWCQIKRWWPLAWWEVAKPILVVYNDFFHYTYGPSESYRLSTADFWSSEAPNTWEKSCINFRKNIPHFVPAKTLTNSTLWSLCTTLIKLFIQFNLWNILPGSPPDIICEFSRGYHYWTMSVSQKKDNIVSLENKHLFRFLSLKHHCKVTWTLMRKRQLHSRGVRPCDHKEHLFPERN